MSLSLKDFEIMAPVGSRESLAAAIQAGADSIYFGIENLNMRARSANTFTIDDLREIARTCDEHGMKSYLTVNTIIYDKDIPLMHTIVDAAKEAGFEPYISVGYRSYADQQQLFNEKASELSQNGVYTYEEAQQIAAEIVAKPGTSDHQTGLAVDILDKEYEVLDYSKMDSKFFDWLDANCAQFGFIKRYPSNKKSVTGWDEPWHYRYVGKEVAEFIMKNGMCLEEFAAHYK